MSPKDYDKVSLKLWHPGVVKLEKGLHHAHFTMTETLGTPFNLSQIKTFKSIHVLSILSEKKRVP